MKQYPRVMTEDETLDLAFQRSIARFGDGEWRCALDGGCTSQRPDSMLARELRHLLASMDSECLVCLPHMRGPRAVSWARYSDAKIYQLCAPKAYGSAFITRPDNAPWIDRHDFWEKVRALWTGVDVVLVVGDKKSITVEMIDLKATSVREVIGPRQHAYEQIDKIEEHIGKTHARVLLCLGATATVLAHRLSKKGIHALDLGHMGMFMRHAGSYRFNADDVATPEYRETITKMHATQRWGVDGCSHADVVDVLAAEIDAKTILDYGCGKNTLAEAMAKLPSKRRVSGYDPGIPERASMPKPCELVVCTDVLEHIEPAKLDNVLAHIFNLTGKAAYFVIATKPAKAILPDGRNAHICLHEPAWWVEKLRSVGWLVGKTEYRKNVHVWTKKPS